ncbi:MAG: hypothetical protein RR497_05955 [Oscillospiraceae bacterium]
MNILQHMGIKKTTASIIKKNLMIKIVAISISGLTLVVGITYAIAFFYKNTGSFTVSLNRYDMLKTGISISETADFKKPTSHLSAAALENAINISGNDLPDDLQSKDGSYGGQNFIGYTYYVKNAGDSTITYKNSLDIEKATMNVDAAIRVKVFVDGVPTDYAKPKKDNSGPEPGTAPFASSGVVMQSVQQDFEPGQIHKYTIAIWLEGNDPDCIDDILGGMVKLTMNMQIIENI